MEENKGKTDSEHLVPSLGKYIHRESNTWGFVFKKNLLNQSNFIARNLPILCISENYSPWSVRDCPNYGTSI